MKRYKFVEEKELIKEMANLRSEDTGLDHGTIYISSKEGNQGPRIKYYRGRPGNTPSASISISNNPEVVEDSIDLKSLEIKELVLFVQKNKSKLLLAWNKGYSMYKDEWNNLINSLEKIK